MIINDKKNVSCGGSLSAALALFLWQGFCHCPGGWYCGCGSVIVERIPEIRDLLVRIRRILYNKGSTKECGSL